MGILQPKSRCRLLRQQSSSAHIMPTHQPCAEQGLQYRASLSCNVTHSIQVCNAADLLEVSLLLAHGCHKEDAGGQQPLQGMWHGSVLQLHFCCVLHQLGCNLLGVQQSLPGRLQASRQVWGMLYACRNELFAGAAPAWIKKGMSCSSK